MFQTILTTPVLTADEFRALTEKESLFVFESIVDLYEKHNFGIRPVVVGKIDSKKDAEMAFKQYWKENRRHVTLPTGFDSFWEDVREHKGYYFRVWKDKGFNCTIIFCKKGGDTVLAGHFGPRYS